MWIWSLGATSIRGPVFSIGPPPMLERYVKKILASRVYDVALETPLDPAPALSQRLANRLWLKREDLQPVHSFKLRGSYNKMVQLSPEERRRGVIAASAGNHAQGVALAAKRLGVKAHDGNTVTGGSILVRQKGRRFNAGLNVGLAKDHSLFAKIDGKVRFEDHGKHGRKISVIPVE